MGLSLVVSIICQRCQARGFGWPQLEVCKVERNFKSYHDSCYVMLAETTMPYLLIERNLWVYTTVGDCGLQDLRSLRDLKLWLCFYEGQQSNERVRRLSHKSLGNMNS